MKLIPLNVLLFCFSVLKAQEIEKPRFSAGISSELFLNVIYEYNIGLDTQWDRFCLSFMLGSIHPSVYLDGFSVFGEKIELLPNDGYAIRSILEYQLFEKQGYGFSFGVQHVYKKAIFSDETQVLDNYDGSTAKLVKTEHTHFNSGFDLVLGNAYDVPLKGNFSLYAKSYFGVGYRKRIKELDTMKREVIPENKFISPVYILYAKLGVKYHF
jgi:hypothetical protein